MSELKTPFVELELPNTMLSWPEDGSEPVPKFHRGVNLRAVGSDWSDPAKRYGVAGDYSWVRLPVRGVQVDESRTDLPRPSKAAGEVECESCAVLRSQSGGKAYENMVKSYEAQLAERDERIKQLREFAADRDGVTLELRKVLRVKPGESVLLAAEELVRKLEASADDCNHCDAADTVRGMEEHLRGARAMNDADNDRLMEAKETERQLRERIERAKTLCDGCDDLRALQRKFDSRSTELEYAMEETNRVKKVAKEAAAQWEQERTALRERVAELEKQPDSGGEQDEMEPSGADMRKWVGSGEERTLNHHDTAGCDPCDACGGCDVDPVDPPARSALERAREEFGKWCDPDDGPGWRSMAELLLLCVEGVEQTEKRLDALESAVTRPMDKGGAVEGVTAPRPFPGESVLVACACNPKPDEVNVYRTAAAVPGGLHVLRVEVLGGE